MLQSRSFKLRRENNSFFKKDHFFQVIWQRIETQPSLMVFCQLSLIQRKICTSATILWHFFVISLSFFKASILISILRIFKLFGYFGCLHFLCKTRGIKMGLTNQRAVMLNEYNECSIGAQGFRFPPQFCYWPADGRRWAAWWLCPW